METAIYKLLDALVDLVNTRDGLSLSLGTDLLDSDLDEDIGKIKEAVVALFGVPELDEFDFLFDDVWAALDSFLESNISRDELFGVVKELLRDYNVAN